MNDQAGADIKSGWTRWMIPPLRIAMVIAAIIMLVLLVVAFAEIFKSVLKYFLGEQFPVPALTAGGKAVSQEAKEGRLEVMTSTVKSFELMLLAPLPFVLIAGLADYLRAVTGVKGGRRGKLLLTEAKALWVGLIVGVFATDLLDEALTGSIKYEQALSSAVIMLLLIGYFFGLEYLTHRSHAKEGE
jgi:hypothetical protein